MRPPLTTVGQHDHAATAAYLITQPRRGQLDGPKRCI
jgi:hypothetical protein